MSTIFERKNVLVTGGAGFIGSHLCDRLIKEANVICVDNFITSSSTNISQLLQNPHFELVNHDIIDPLDLEVIPELNRFKLRFQGIQEVYHLACPISKRHFDNYKIATVLTNSIGIKNILDLAVKYSSKVLYASSGVLYGHKMPGERRYFSERDECRLDHMTERGAYDEGKRFSEAILQTYAEVHHLDVKIARIFRTIGARMKIFDGHLLPEMILSALEGKELVVQGDEESSTSLCDVTDIVDGLLRLMSTPVDVTLVNLGSDVEVRLVSIAQRIQELVGAHSRIHFEPASPGYVEPGLPDISRARDILGWMPVVRMDDALKRMVDYAQSHRQQIKF